MTGPAYGTEYDYFNHETDVLLWNEEYDGIVKSIVDDIDKESEIIKVRYMPEDNGRKTEADRLEEIYNSIIKEVKNKENYDEI